MVKAHPMPSVGEASSPGEHRSPHGGTAVAAVHVRTLQRAAQQVGGVEMLASHLKVRPSRLTLWLQGRVSPPLDVFLRAVDLVTQDERGLKPPARERGTGNPGADLPS